MALRPPKASLRPSLAGWFCATSLILAWAAPAAAQQPAGVGEAVALLAEGRLVAARTRLEAALADARQPGARLAVLRTLLDVCLQARDDACVVRHTQAIADPAALAPGNPALQAELDREAAYYMDEGRLARGEPALTARILDGAAWRNENAFNGELYLRRQLLAARILAAQGKAGEASGALDKALSLVASARNLEAAAFTLARTMAEAIRLLAELGETERAWGLYRAAGADIARLLPEPGADAAVFRLTEARLLQEMGEFARSAEAAEAALAALARLELEPPVRARLAGEAVVLRASACAAAGRLECAREALAAHPAAAFHGGPGRRPADPGELRYLVLRTYLAAIGGAADPVAADALKPALAFRAEHPAAAGLEIHRQAAAALARPAGPARTRALAAAARALAGGGTAAGRPDALDRLLMGLLLAQAEAGPETDFALVQLAGRSGPVFDADALAAVSQTRGELQRRAAHQALRLRARRDRLEREGVQAALAAAARAPAPALLSHDPAARLRLRDFAVRIAAAEAGAVPGGATEASPARLPTLRSFQAVLAKDEAALAVSAVPGGLAYLCVRRDGVTRSQAPVDAGRVRLDGRLLQAALTAGHPPSETLDAQYPVEAAGRLYDVLVRPFEACLKPGDRIVWLPGLAGLEAPLAALLAAPPPKLASGGYDLAQADWLIRHHPVSYAGSAAVVLAARSAAPAAAGDFDFLGVGDPVLEGGGKAGAARGALLRGVSAGSRFAGLAPLPETRDELQASARPFATSRLLLGPEATERGLRGQLVGAYSYLSFATHGLIREDLQGLAEPALVLTPVAADDPLDDGLLTASEIADLNLRARFVALSACNTANFDLDQFARDLPALTSAFAVAGVPATLATLWPVDSETSRRVVTATFERLRGEGLGPAEALAEAQRAFLAAPPGKAWLHPRFWAPFVVLGDGGRLPAPPAASPAVRQVEVLTRRQGEVIALDRTPQGVAARLISDADEAGRHGAAARLASGPGREAWRVDDRTVGASRFTARLGDSLVVSGYARDAAGRFGPVLQAVDAGGRVTKTWRPETPGRMDAMVLGGASAAAGRGLFLVGEVNLRGAPADGGPRMDVYEVDAALQPRRLFEVAGPAGWNLSAATVTPLGEDVLVTYTDETARAPDLPEPTLDDWDQPPCLWRPLTRVELRDGRTGALKASRELPGQTVAAAQPADGRVLLGGAVRAACGDEGRANVLAVDAALAPRAAWADGSLGASEVRALGAAPGGRVVVAASKAAVTDFAPPAAPGRPRPYGERRLDRTFSGMVVVLDRDGRASAPRLLDSGAHVLVTAVDARDPGDILVGGALAGEAAIFHLDAGR